MCEAHSRCGTAIWLCAQLGPDWAMLLHALAWPPAFSLGDRAAASLFRPPRSQHARVPAQTGPGRSPAPAMQPWSTQCAALFDALSKAAEGASEGEPTRSTRGAAWFAAQPCKGRAHRARALL